MSENPYKSAETETSAVPGRFRLTPARVILGLVAIVIAIAFLLPAQRGTREAPNRTQCLNNVKQILLALHNYREAHGTLPPAYTVDDEGNRLHSWRTLILPYLDQQELYDEINLTKPWDDPANAEARETVVYIYYCPSSPVELDETTYLAVIGPDGAFSGSDGKRWEDLPAGAANTIAIVDVSYQHSVHWMSPNDISVDELLAYDTETRLHHGKSLVCGFADGSVETFGLHEKREELHSVLKMQPLSAK